MCVGIQQETTLFKPSLPSYFSYPAALMTVCSHRLVFCHISDTFKVLISEHMLVRCLLHDHTTIDKTQIVFDLFPPAGCL